MPKPAMGMPLASFKRFWLDCSAPDRAPVRRRSLRFRCSTRAAGPTAVALGSFDGLHPGHRSGRHQHAAQRAWCSVVSF